MVGCILSAMIGNRGLRQGYLIDKVDRMGSQHILADFHGKDFARPEVCISSCHCAECSGNLPTHSAQRTAFALGPLSATAQILY